MKELHKKSEVSNLTHEKVDLEDVVFGRLTRLGVFPNENLGQHFLIDQTAIDLLAHSVTPGNNVLEIGAGIGQLTEALATNSVRVTAVEIDRRFEPVLADLSARYPNVNIVYGDVLTLGLDRLTRHSDGNGTQIIASIPYHITEPLMRRLVNLDIESATMVVGRKFSESIQATSEQSLGFGKLTLLAQSFYDIEVLIQLGRDSFFPSPSTESAVIRFTPREGDVNIRDFLLRKLFVTSRQNPLVKNCLKEGLTEFIENQKSKSRSKKRRSRVTRRSTKLDLRYAAVEYNTSGRVEAVSKDINGKAHMVRAGEKAIIEGLGLPSDILDRTFDRLSKSELRVLSEVLRRKAF